MDTDQQLESTLIVLTNEANCLVRGENGTTFLPMSASLKWLQNWSLNVGRGKKEASGDSCIVLRMCVF